MGWYLDGRVTAVVGTHTHVPTADARVLPKGTAYISDIGMTGPRDSIIGFSLETVLPRFLTHLPTRFNVAEGPVSLNAVVIEAERRDWAGALDRAGSAPDRGLAGQPDRCRRRSRAASRSRRRWRPSSGPPPSGKTDLALAVARAPASRDPGRRLTPGVPRHGHRHRQAGCGRARRGAASPAGSGRSRCLLHRGRLGRAGTAAGAGDLGAGPAAAGRRRNRPVRQRPG